MVHRTGALILVDDPGEEKSRLESFEISATGPIFGTKTRWPRGQPLDLEREALESLGLPWGPGLEPPRGHRLPGGRRPLRAELMDPVLEIRGKRAELKVSLPSGSYVTILLEELFPEGIVDGATGEEL
jgi:tRNA pseudouridine13 synthase